MADVSVLNVNLYAEPVGTLTRLQGDKTIFAFNDAYIADEEAALQVNRSKRFDGFAEDELAGLAARTLLPKAVVLDEAHKTVELFYEHWHSAKKELPIDAHLQKIPIA